MDGVRPYWVFLRSVPGRDVRDRVSEWMTEWFHHANKGDHPDVSLWAITGVQRRTVARRPSLPPGAAAAVSVTIWDSTIPDRNAVDGIAFAALVRVAALLPSLDSEALTDLPGVIEPLRGVSEVVLTLDGGAAALVFAHRLAASIAETWRSAVIQVADEDPPEDFAPATVDEIGAPAEMPDAEAEPPDPDTDGTTTRRRPQDHYTAWAIIGASVLLKDRRTPTKDYVALLRKDGRLRPYKTRTVEAIMAEGRAGELGPPYPR